MAEPRVLLDGHQVQAEREGPLHAREGLGRLSLEPQVEFGLGQTCTHSALIELFDSSHSSHHARYSDRQIGSEKKIGGVLKKQWLLDAEQGKDVSLRRILPRAETDSVEEERKEEETKS